MANKKELINAIALATGKTKKDSKLIADSLIKVMKTELSKGVDSTIKLVNFGTFKVVTRKARVGRNPRTGEKLDIPAKNVVKFTPGKALKELIDFTSEEKAEIGDRDLNPKKVVEIEVTETEAEVTE